MTHGDSYLMIGGNGVAFFVFDLRSAVSATWLCFEAVQLHAQYYYLKQAGRVRLRKNNSVIPAAMLLHKAFFF